MPAAARIGSVILTPDCVAATLLDMEVHFTPEQEAQLAKLAGARGVSPEALVRDEVLRSVDEDENFHAAIRKGIEQADQGLLIDEAEMDARVARMLGAS